MSLGLIQDMLYDEGYLQEEEEVGEIKINNRPEWNFGEIIEKITITPEGPEKTYVSKSYVDTCIPRSSYEEDESIKEYLTDWFSEHSIYKHLFKAMIDKTYSSRYNPMARYYNIFIDDTNEMFTVPELDFNIITTTIDKYRDIVLKCL